MACEDNGLLLKAILVYVLPLSSLVCCQYFQDSDRLRTRPGVSIRGTGRTVASTDRVSCKEGALPASICHRARRRAGILAQLIRAEHCAGVCETADGERYSGSYVYGQPHGKGTYKVRKQYIIPTRYVESRRSALSAVTEILTPPRVQFKNGNVYEGEYKEGKICGYG